MADIIFNSQLDWFDCHLIILPVSICSDRKKLISNIDRGLNL